MTKCGRILNRHKWKILPPNTDMNHTNWVFKECEKCGKREVL